MNFNSCKNSEATRYIKLLNRISYRIVNNKNQLFVINLNLPCAKTSYFPNFVFQFYSHLLIQSLNLLGDLFACHSIYEEQNKTGK